MQQTRRLQPERGDDWEGSSGLLEVTAVHVSSVQVGHLPVHPAHLRAGVGTELHRGPPGVRIIQPDEDGSSVGLLISQDFPEVERSGEILVLVQEDVSLVAAHIRVLEDAVCSSEHIKAFPKTEEKGIREL